MTATVLVVDDEADVVSMYAAWLEDDYDVLQAQDGRSALQQLEDHEVDVVLLDRRMPDMRGEDVLEEMRERGHRSMVAVVTAVEPDFDIIDMGFDDYLTKPVSRDEVHDTVESLLQRDEYGRKTQEQFSLMTKKIALEDSKTEAELQESDEYAELVERLDEVTDETRELLDEMSDDDYRRLLEDLG